MNMHDAEVPKMAEDIVPTESAMKRRLMPGIFPSLSVIPVLWQIPIAVPVRHSRSTQRNDRTVKSMSADRILLHSNLQKIGAMLSGNATTP